jgi:MinD-like ATPase involved in chromosome partitioning or flagellar assembly
MVTLVLAVDHTMEDRILADLVQRGHVILARAETAEDLLGAISAQAPECVIVSAKTSTLSADVLALCDDWGVRLIALAASEAERRHAAGLGLYEVLDASAPWAEIEAVLAGGNIIPLRLGERPAATLPLRSSSVIAVWGPAGAPGRTTLAINIAAELAAAGHTVVLADVDTYSGSVAPTLGLLDEAPGFAAACRLAGTDSLTRSELERIAHRYNSPQGAFWVLTGIGRPSRWPELSTDRVTSTIESLRGWVDYVVLDTGFNLESDEEISSDLFAPRRNAATLAALQCADRVVACGLADPVGLARFLRAWVELADVISTNQVHVLINQVRASAVGLRPAVQITAALRRFGGIESPVLVPCDQAGLDAAVLTGRTLRDAVPRSPARASIRAFVQTQILAEPTLPKESRRRKSRAR